MRYVLGEVRYMVRYRSEGRERILYGGSRADCGKGGLVRLLL